ncbi:MAG: LemA family protein [Chitinophagaceae bacterium]|jgi:LemA protein|nr:LemA family protein [Bacteroidota bacterium]MBK9506020.1 LemA family protein [Bacteroidota bacterium]MBK9555490.1 LemA family protein [Bacteroidota bacterium]MBL0279817.1 LemA family protein [Bacteroidota bacterium]MBP9879919.1 LemA family protein [Chitinophagales bacterium]
MATTTPAAPAKSRIGLFITLGVILVIFLGARGTYNGMVTADETANEKWNNVESAYQRRLDLIDNLVNTVKGAADFEKSTLTEIIEARAKATNVTIDPSKATPEQLQSFTEAQNGVNSALSKLLVVVENYPTLTATQAYRDLMSSLEGTENRINVARVDYNEAIKNYNTRIRKFPANILASITGFEKRNGFTAAEGADKAPKVDFSDNK